MSSARTKRPLEHRDDEPKAKKQALTHDSSRAYVIVMPNKRDLGKRFGLTDDQLKKLFLLFKGCIVKPTLDYCYYTATYDPEEIDKVSAVLKADLGDKWVVDFQPYGIELRTSVKPSMLPHPTAPDTVIEPGDLSPVNQQKNEQIQAMDKVYSYNRKFLLECGDNVYLSSASIDLLVHLESERRDFIARWRSLD